MPPVSGPRKVYLGVDPGANGGLAAVTTSGSFGVASMPDTERDVWEWFADVKRQFPGCDPFAVIEKVSGYIGEAQPGSAAFKFGASYGGLRMALVAAGIPFEEVTPQKWQKFLGIPPRNNKGGETKTAFKNRLKAKAQQLFPGVKVTLATADALLIMEYCRRVHGTK